jgi:putative ABC transport system permease protein
MLETVRNLARRKLRTSLTILGITGGVLALTVMGAMSERINLIVEGAIKYYKTRVVVQPKSVRPGHLFGPPLSLSITDRLMEIPGVAATSPTVQLIYSEEAGKMPGLGLFLPLMIAGVEARFFDLENGRYPIELSAGRTFTQDEKTVTVVGIDMARAKRVGVGGSLRVRGRNFKVVGVMAQSLTVRDKMAFLPFREAQEMLASVLPRLLFPNPYVLATEIEVYPSDGVDADTLARTINDQDQFEGIQALLPSDIENQFRQNLVIFNVILVSNAIIAILVGGLAILNTMVMAVSERTREIGIKKALGASKGDIAREVLNEAALMGFIGGILGILAGTLLVFLLNLLTADEGIAIFAVTPRLVLFIIVFAVLLGSTAGLYPALRAARSSPMQCLRTE